MSSSSDYDVIVIACIPSKTLVRGPTTSTSPTMLPNSELRPLDAGHFVWEQAPHEYGRLIAEWVNGGFQRLGGR
jgi:hypothetical protein